MLIVRRKNRFKVVALVTAAATLWLSVEGTASAAPRATPLRLQVGEVAGRLGVDPSQLTGEGRAESGPRAAERRARALERLEARTSQREKAAETAVVAAAIRREHLPSLLGGVAQASEEARQVARAAGGDRSRATARLGEISSAIEHGLKRAERAQGIDRRLAPAAANARRLARAAERASAGRGESAEVERLAPPRASALDTRARVPMQLRRALPPTPRAGVKLGAIPTFEQRALYASLLDAPGLEVETEVGLASPGLLAAGFALEPMLAIGSVDAGIEALLELAAGALPGPAPADLSDGPEARITPEIQVQAEQLGRDPLAIFNFVHDGFAAQPYYGAKKGSVGALAERAGNDADLSALLVALLRASGIPARFEYGTVDLSSAQAMAWTGTTDVFQAGDALASGGIPTTIVDRGTDRVVRVEHVWVRAWVPYSNYRGLPRPGSRATWVRLDPTLQRATVRGATNVRGRISFDYAAYLAQVSSRTPLQVFEDQLRAYALANGIPCRTLEDFIPAREQVVDALTLLPAELPAPVFSGLATFAGLPTSMRHAATLDVGGLRFTTTLPEVYGTAMTLRYRGATAADDATIAAASGIANVSQPSSVHVVPTLVVDGTERARGNAVIPGVQQELAVQVSSPHEAAGLVRHQILAGSVFAVGFPVGKVPNAVVEKHELAHSRAVLSNLTGDDLEAARGNRALWRYFWHLGRDWERLFGLEWSRVEFGVSEGIAGRTLRADALYGVPVSIRAGDFVVDVPRLVAAPYMVDGQHRDRLPAVFELAGYDGSAWEHLVLEETVHVPSISTVRIFQAARQQGLQLRTLTAADTGVVASLPFTEFAREDIADALHRGLEVTLPERPVTWGPYANAEGYVLKDPRTGAADYRIKGLFSGGQSNGSGGPNLIACGECSGASGAGGSRVRISDGAMYFSETDLVVPARGIPVSFTRRYNSASPHGGRLGPGWQHTYEVKLVAEPDGSVTFVNGELLAVRYSRAPDGSYVAPAGFHERLVPSAEGHRLIFKDGLEYRFGADGQLIAIQDANDHLVLLRYEAGRLASATDAGARPVLTFSYDGAGQLASVRDLAGRVVQFGHDRGDLVAVTDVLGNVQRFEYDSRRRMTSKTDRNGNTTLEFYDGEGRWIGSQDALGNGRSVAYDMVNRRAVHQDKTGGTTVFEYNEQGNPIAVTDPAGNRREMRWENHRKVWERDARGNEASYAYDASGNLERRTDALGTVTQYTYDGGGRVLAVRTNGALIAQNTYDARGNLETSTDALLRQTRYAYTADGLPATITQPGNAVTSLEYNADGTVRAVTDGEGGRTELAYDPQGHLSTITDALRQSRTMAADAAGRIHSMTDALGRTTQFEYDREGNRTAVVDQEQHRTEFAYDPVGHLTTVIDTRGAAARTGYDGEGRVVWRQDPVGRTTRYRYDAAGRLIETTDGAGNRTVQGYCADVSSQACAIVDALGNYTEIEYDALGRPIITVDPNLRRTVQHYDAQGRRDRTVVAGQETVFGYDDAGRLRRVTDALGGVTEYDYDERGNRTLVKDANGNETHFGYDRANRLVWERNPIQAVGAETRYEYDSAGNRRFKVDGNGARTEYQYDPNRRLRSVLFADGARYDYDYDVRGNRTLERSPTHERALAYDELGRLRRVEDRTVGHVIEYAYDAAGQRRRMTLETGEAVEYRWDGVGRLLETTDPQGQTTRFAYDAGGRRVETQYGNGTRATYAYDAVGQVLSIAYLDASGSIQTAFGYGYDTAGNRTHKAFADGLREEYGYDALNRLTSAKYADARQVTYAYDAVGNRRELVDSSGSRTTQWAASATASTGSAADAAGAPDGRWWNTGSHTREEWLEVTFANPANASGIRIREGNNVPFVTRVDLIDTQGQSHTVFSGPDRTAGNPGLLVVPVPLTPYKVARAKVVVSGSVGYEWIDAVGIDVPRTETYAYNAFNQLLSVAVNDGTRTSFGYDGNGNQISKTEVSGATTSTTTYVYNDDNRLVGISLPNGGSNAFEYDANGLRTLKRDSTGTTRYLLDGISVIAQYAPGGARQAWYTQSLARIDEVLNVANDSGKFWYQADALGSVYGLTNQAGALIGNQNYDVFGAPTPAPSGPAGQPFGFTGREHELDSGLVYARARYLNPAVGAWLQRDRARFVNGPNMYRYAMDAPTRVVDPLGLYVAYVDADLKPAWDLLDASATAIRLKWIAELAPFAVYVMPAYTLFDPEEQVVGRTGNGFGETGHEGCSGGAYFVEVRVDVGGAAFEQQREGGGIPLNVYVASTLAHELGHIEQLFGVGVQTLVDAYRDHSNAADYVISKQYPGLAKEIGPKLLGDTVFQELAPE